jgi:integrase
MAIHGLRKNAAIELDNAGCSTQEIAAITGHRTLGMVAHYSKKRDQRLHARSAMEKRDERKVANSGTEQDNSSGKPFDN